MATRVIKSTDTIETLRVTFNGMAVDVGDITDLNTPFVGVPTDLVEAVNSKSDSADIDEQLDSTLQEAKDYTDSLVGGIDHTTYELKVDSQAGDVKALADANTYTDEQMLTASGNGATGGGDEQIFFINQTIMNIDYAIPTGYNAVTAGPLVQNATTTIPEGSVWVIV